VRPAIFAAHLEHAVSALECRLKKPALLRLGNTLPKANRGLVVRHLFDVAALCPVAAAPVLLSRRQSRLARNGGRESLFIEAASGNGR
jgi:hypothetical protein